MDILDATIIGRLTHPPPHGVQFDVRVSYADVGRDLGVDEETVRTRVKRLQEEGFILGWRVAVTPGVLGRTMVRLEVPPVELGAREKVRSALAALDGAMWVFEYHSGAMAVVLFAPPGAAVQRSASLIAAFAGPPVLTPGLRIPPPGMVPSALDWRVIQALRNDPRKPYATLAGELGVSEKTVRRRLDALTEAKVLMLTADIDATKLRGGLPVTAHVAMDGGPGRADVDRQLRDMPGTIFFASDERGIRASHLLASLAEVEAYQHRIAAMPGVRRVKVEFQVRRISVETWMDEEIARRAGAA